MQIFVSYVILEATSRKSITENACKYFLLRFTKQ